MKTFNEQDDSYRWLLGGAVLCQALHQTPPDFPWAQAGFMWHWSAVELAQLNHEFAYFSGAVLDLPQLQTRKYSFSFGRLPDQQWL